MRRRLMPFAAIGMIGLASCSRGCGANATSSADATDPHRDLLVDAALCRTPSAPSVTRAQARHDTATLARILREGYAGFDELARRGIDWDAVFASLSQTVEQAGEPIDVETLRQNWVDVLTVARDAHLALSTISPGGEHRRGDAGRHEHAYTADLELSLEDPPRVLRSATKGVVWGATLVGCKGALLRDLLRPALAGLKAETVARLIVRSEYEPAPLSCRFDTKDGIVSASLALRPVRSALAEPRAPTFELADGEVARIRVGSFNPSHKRELDAFVASAASVRGRLALVLDVRGNGGGADPFYMDFFRDLVDGELVRPDIQQLRTAVTRQGDLVRVTCQLAGSTLDAIARKDFDERRRIAEGEVEHPSPERWQPRKTTVRGRASPPFRGKLIALTDARCGSACDGFVHMARQVPGALVLGSNTAGVATFGEVRPYRLPETGIWVHVPTMFLSMPEAFREGYGFEPDLWIDDEDVQPVAVAGATCFARGAVCAEAIEHAVGWRAR